MVYIPRYSKKRMRQHKWVEMHEALGMIRGHVRFKRDLFLIIGDDLMLYLNLLQMLRSDQLERCSDEEKKEKIKQFKELANDCKSSEDLYELLEKHYPGACMKYWHDPDDDSKL